MSRSANDFTSVVKALNEFIEVEPDFKNMPIADVQAMLRSEGVDVNRTIKDIGQIIKKRVSAEKLEKARQLRSRLLNLISSVESKHAQLVDSLGVKREVILKDIELLASNVLGGLPSLYFRKLEKASDKDLLILLQDLKNLSAIDQDEG